MSGLNRNNLIARCGLITASGFGIYFCLPEDDTDSIAQVTRIAQERADGKVKPSKPNMFMQYGIDNEDAAVSAFTHDGLCNIHHLEVVPNKDLIRCDYVSPDGVIVPAGATPDALMGGCPVEMKVPYTANSFRKQRDCVDWVGMNMTNEDCPEDFKYVRRYLWQLRFQMWVLEQANGNPVNSGTLAFYNAQNGKVKCHTLERFEYHNRLIEEKIVAMELAIRDAVNEINNGNEDDV